jgi:hypothetical protein
MRQRVSLTELKLVQMLFIEVSMAMRRNTRHDEMNTYFRNSSEKDGGQRCHRRLDLLSLRERSANGNNFRIRCLIAVRTETR